MKHHTALIFFKVNPCIQVVKLHARLGKPIPSTDPVVLGTNAASETSATTPTTPGNVIM